MKENFLENRQNSIVIGKALLLSLFCFILPSAPSLSDSFFGDELTIRGNVDIQTQYYVEDSLIGAERIDEAMLWNSFAYFNMAYKGFDLQMRYEYFQPPMLNLPRDYQGQGIPFLGLTYTGENFKVTAGSFYDQIGSGLIFRSFWEPNLGIDNFVDGFRAEYSPIEGIDLKLITGRQRNYWDFGDGLVRAGDMELNLTTLYNDATDSDVGNQLIMGIGATSRYEPDRESFYNLPENVFATSARLGYFGSDFQIEGEYAYKVNDPTILNEYVYNSGNALLLNTAYFTDGFSINLDFHRIDNMDFRNERTAQLQDLFLNFIPPINKQHTYRLATVFPYATQTNGEFAFAGDITTDLPTDDLFGLKYDGQLVVNYSQVNELDTTQVSEFEYEGGFFDVSDVIYFRDFNIEYSQKWSKKFKTTFTYLHQQYNRDVLENGRKPKWGSITNDILVFEASYRLGGGHALRGEFQKSWYQQDSIAFEPDNISGDWVMGLLEYTNPLGWYLTLWGEYNYGNPFEDRQLLYPNATVSYVHDANRFTVGYGRQRAGWLCVGGVCRLVPASNGLYLQITSTF